MTDPDLYRSRASGQMPRPGRVPPVTRSQSKPARRSAAPVVLAALLGLIVGAAVGYPTGHKAGKSYAGIDTVRTATVTAAAGRPRAAVTRVETVTVEVRSTAASTAPAYKPHPVLDQQGDGTLTTSTFRVRSSQWAFQYSFACGEYGGIFQVYLYGTDGQLRNVIANSTADSDNQTSYEHGAGAYYLELNTTCNWHVRVTG